jgi:hypothetical protein
MLHMVVNTHNPESCAFRGEEEDRLLSGALERFEEDGPESVMKVTGSYINRSGHEFFILIDAPNAHVIEEAVVASGLVGRSHTRVLPVLASQDVEVTHADN